MSDQTLPEVGTLTVTAVDDDEPNETDGTPGRLRPILFRLHFLGGFFAAPVVLWLAVTGVLFAWNPQIESLLFGDEWAAAEAEGDMQPLSAQLGAVGDAYPGHDIVELAPAPEVGETTAVLVKPAGAQAEGFGPAPGAFTAYVDPVTTDVTGRVHESRRPDEWLRNLHSNFRLGDRAGTLTELAASWVLVSLLTGLYLWWPRTRRALRRALTPRLQGLCNGGRRPWRNLHSSIGVVTLSLLAILVVTGLTWTEFAGRWVDVAKDGIGAEAPSLQTELTDGNGATGGHHETGSGQQSGSGTGLDDVDPVAAAAEDADITPPFTITPASEPGQAWTIAELDDRWPIERTTIAVDPTTGRVTDELAFSDDPLIDQLTSIGIGFHQGSLFGLLNQILLTLLAVALIALLVTGYVMWWKRRPAGAFGPPPKFGPILRNVPMPVLAGFVALMILLPTMGVSFLLYLLVERAIWLARRQRALRVG